MKLRQTIIRLGALASALLSGTVFVACPAYGGQALYGPPPIPLPHEPDVTITDFSYTPASPIHLGETLTFSATLSRHTDAGWISAVVKKPELASAYCNDLGLAADAAPGDGIYTGTLDWEPPLSTGTSLPVYAELVWEDGAPGPTLDAPPLTILAAEEGP